LYHCVSIYLKNIINLYLKELLEDITKKRAKYTENIQVKMPWCMMLADYVVLVGE